MSQETEETLRYILIDFLKLLHPFMPHITEKIWEYAPHGRKKMLMIEEWPKR